MTSTQLIVAGTLAGDLINLLLFVIFALQLRALRRQIRLSAANAEFDHDRERQQATIDFYRGTLDKRSQMRLRLPDDRDRNAIADLTKMIAKDEDAAGPAAQLGGRARRRRAARTTRDIAEYLNLFELLAGGVNSEVFDLDTIDRIAGSRICAIASNYRPWIELRRQKLGQNRLYCELAALADAIQTRRERSPARAPEDSPA